MMFYSNTNANAIVPPPNRQTEHKINQQEIKSFHSSRKLNKMSPRIALLFFGRIRGYDVCRGDIVSNILHDDENAADVFLSHSPELDEDLDAFADMYHPKAVVNDAIVYEDVSRYPISPKTIVPSKHAVMCHLTNKKRVFESSNTHVPPAYDIYICLRLDHCFDTKLNFSFFFENMSDNTIFIPEGDDHLGVNDRCAIGNFAAMKTYTSLIDEIYILLDRGCNFHPETLLLAYLKNKNMNIVRFPLRYLRLV